MRTVRPQARRLHLSFFVHLGVVLAPVEHVLPGNCSVVSAYVHRHTSHVRMEHRCARGAELVDQILYQSAKSGIESSDHPIQEMTLKHSASSTIYFATGSRSD